MTVKELRALQLSSLSWWFGGARTCAVSRMELELNANTQMRRTLFVPRLLDSWRTALASEIVLRSCRLSDKSAKKQMSLTANVSKEMGSQKPK